MGKWMVSAKKADFNEIAKRFHIDPVTSLAFIYWGFTLAMTSYDMKPIEKDN